MNASTTQQRARLAYDHAAQTLPPAQKVVLLYEAAIRRLKEARAAIAENRIEDRFHKIAKTSAIVDALQSALDFQHGGEVAPLLDRFYSSVLVRLQRINLRNDGALCDELIAQLETMRHAWKRLAGDQPELMAQAEPGARAVAAAARSTDPKPTAQGRAVTI